MPSSNYSWLFPDLKELKITGEGNYTGDFVKHSWVIEITENVPVRHVRNLIVTFEGVEGLYNSKFDIAEFSEFDALVF